MIRVTVEEQKRRPSAAEFVSFGTAFQKLGEDNVTFIRVKPDGLLPETHVWAVSLTTGQLSRFDPEKEVLPVATMFVTGHSFRHF